MTPEQRLIENIHMVAAHRRVTRKDMAEYLGVQVQTIYRRMANESTWPTSDLIRVAKLLEVDVSVLWSEEIGFGRDGPRAITGGYAPSPEAGVA